MLYSSKHLLDQDSRGGGGRRGHGVGGWDLDLVRTLTPSLCILKCFSHFSFSAESGQTDRQTDTLVFRTDRQTDVNKKQVIQCPCCAVTSPATRLPPSTPHGWGKGRSNDAATVSRRGFLASACSRALCSPSPERSLHTDTNTVRAAVHSHEVSGFAACHPRVQSYFHYPPRGPAVYSSLSCEPLSCPCPS